MKRNAIMSFMLILLMSKLHAWDFLQASGGRSNSLGKCSVALNDFWSLHNNPAGFASNVNYAIGFSYENRFLLKELSYKKAGAMLPSKFGVLGISVSQFGYEHYQENLFGLALSRNFGTKLRIGMKLDYLVIKFSGEYRKLSVPTFEVGIQYQINESLCLGAYFFNPLYVNLKTLNKDKIPIIIKLGFSYAIINNLLITSEVEENIEYNFSYRLGLEYEIFKNIFIRSGFQINPETFTFGVGYNHRLFIVDFAADMNHTTGASLGCSLIFNLKNRN